MGIKDHQNTVYFILSAIIKLTTLHKAKTPLPETHTIYCECCTIAVNVTNMGI